MCTTCTLHLVAGETLHHSATHWCSAPTGTTCQVHLHPAATLQVVHNPAHRWPQLLLRSSCCSYAAGATNPGNVIWIRRIISSKINSNDSNYSSNPSTITINSSTNTIISSSINVDPSSNTIDSNNTIISSNNTIDISNNMVSSIYNTDPGIINIDNNIDPNIIINSSYTIVNIINDPNIINNIDVIIIDNNNVIINNNPVIININPNVIDNNNVIINNDPIVIINNRVIDNTATQCYLHLHAGAAITK